MVLTAEEKKSFDDYYLKEVVCTHCGSKNVKVIVMGRPSKRCCCFVCGSDLGCLYSSCSSRMGQ